MIEKLKDLLFSCTFTSKDIVENYGGVNEYYREDKKVHDKARRQAREILARYTPTEAELLEASKRAFSGRLQWVNDRWEYTAGQFYDLELPQAIHAVLDYARLKKGVVVRK